MTELPLSVDSALLLAVLPRILDDVDSTATASNDGHTLTTAASAISHRAAVPDQDNAPDPTGHRQALRRVVVHLLSHAYGVGEQLESGKWRHALPEQLPRFTDDAAALTWFEREYDAVLAAQRVALELGEVALAWPFGEACWPALRHLRRHDDQLAVQEIAARAAALTDDRSLLPVHSVALTRTAWALRALDRPRDAVDAATAALEIATRVDHDLAKSTALSERGRCYCVLGHFDRALADQYAAMAIDQARVVTGPDGQTSGPVTAIGLRWLAICDTQLAADYVEAAVQAALNAIATFARDPRRVRELVKAKIAVGLALIAAGRPIDATAQLRAAHDLLDPASDTTDLATIARALHEAGAAPDDSPDERGQDIGDGVGERPRQTPEGTA